MPVERNGNLRARRLVAGAGNRQIRAFLRGVMMSSTAMVLMASTGAPSATVTDVPFNHRTLPTILLCFVWVAPGSSKQNSS
ncbi:hypothetical protein [Escherichia coli]|uniref:hypothetical protein n=1 Tax=Escherichia coli TaxID=562 RepID=UPI00178CC572